jgi:hypothetical protein
MSQIIENTANNSPTDATHLKCLNSVILPATSGEATFAKSNAISYWFEEREITWWDMDKPGVDTIETVANIYEQSNDALYYFELFSSISSDTSKLYWSQGQIIEFAQYIKTQNPDTRVNKLAYLLLFVIKPRYIYDSTKDKDKDKELFVKLYFVEGDFVFSINCFNDYSQLDPEYRYRIVVPKQIVR